MPNNLPAKITSTKFNQAEVALLRESYAKDLDDTSLKIFLKQAEAMDLNPFTKEIYGVKVSGRLVLMTSIEGRRKIAHKSGKYLGCKITNKFDSEGKVVSATAVAKKLVGSHVAEFEYTAYFDEFSSGRDNWVKMQVVMINKVAESNVLRMAFPQIDNIYDEAERATVEAVHDTVEVDHVPEPEMESQEQVSLALPSPSGDPGVLMVKLGSKEKAAMIKDLPRQKLVDFVSWAYGQTQLNQTSKVYLSNIEAFLEQTQGEPANVEA